MSGDRDYLYGDQPWHADTAARGRKKTVRFDSVADPSRSYGQAPGPGPPDYGWMTIQDLRGGGGGAGRWAGPGAGLVHRAPHLWDRQESLDSQARSAAPHVTRCAHTRSEGVKELSSTELKLKLTRTLSLTPHLGFGKWKMCWLELKSCLILFLQNFGFNQTKTRQPLNGCDETIKI